MICIHTLLIVFKDKTDHFISHCLITYVLTEKVAIQGNKRLSLSQINPTF